MPERIDTTKTHGEHAAFGTFGFTKREVMAALFYAASFANPDPSRYNLDPNDAVKEANRLIAALNAEEDPRG